MGIHHFSHFHPCQCLITLIVKLLPYIQFSPFSLKSFSLVLSQELKTLSPFFLQPPFRAALRPSWNLLQNEQPCFSQPVLVEEVCHPLDHFCDTPLDALLQVNVMQVVPCW